MLRRLVDEFEERAFLSVLQGADTLTILSESSDYAVQAIGWVGRVSPAYCTSVGHALLIDHDRPALDRLFRDTEFRRLGPNTVRNVRELARRIDAARERGYAIADEELESAWSPLRCRCATARAASSPPSTSPRPSSGSAGASTRRARR